MITRKATALMVAAALTVAFLPLGASNVWADNTQILAISDDDEVTQENEAKVKQEIEKNENNAVAIGDTPTAAAGQSNTNTATVAQVNSNTDDDTFVQTAVIEDEDFCSDLFQSLGICVAGEDDD
jgi:hypothetical protein